MYSCGTLWPVLPLTATFERPELMGSGAKEKNHRPEVELKTAIDILIGS